MLKYSKTLNLIDTFFFIIFRYGCQGVSKIRFIPFICIDVTRRPHHHDRLQVGIYSFTRIMILFYINVKPGSSNKESYMPNFYSFFVEGKLSQKGNIVIFVRIFKLRVFVIPALVFYFSVL